MAGLIGINEATLAAQFPLHYACKEGDFETMKCLLEINPNVITSEDSFMNWTPGHWAAYFGKLDCLKYITSTLVNGVNLQTSKTYMTPSHLACQAKHAHCLLWLLHLGANVNIKDFSGETPLHKCAAVGSAECVSLLIAASCDLRIVNNVGETAGMVAERSGHPKIVAYIHQAELTRELGQFEQHPFAVGQPCRKRRLDSMAFNECSKRKRSETPPMLAEQPQMDSSMMDDNMNTSMEISSATTSVIEHEKLCRMEFGYRNSMLQCMINQFHGF